MSILRTALGYSRVLLLVLPLGACVRKPALDPDAVFRQATALRQRGDLPQALALD